MQGIQVGATGGPEVLRYVELEEPKPGDGEALVDIAAAGVNFIDTYHRTGLYPLDLPFVPGSEAAGTVVATGVAVEGIAAGDRVAYVGSPGAYAERAVISADRLVTVPEGVSLETAAAAMLQGMTAHYLAHDTHPLDADSVCLIHAGAGGVGLLLIQMAKMLGAEVFTTVSTTEKAELASTAGADHVIRYTEEDFVTAVRDRMGNGPGLDVVYDGVAATTFDGGLELLRPRGTMVLFGQSSGPIPPVDPAILNLKGSLYLTRPSLFHYIATRAELERRTGDIFGWIADGSLDVRIGATFPLEKADDAHTALEGRRTAGKVILIP